MARRWFVRSCVSLRKLAHPKGFEPLASAFGGQRSIQLSYGCFTTCLAHGPRFGKANLRSREGNRAKN